MQKLNINDLRSIDMDSGLLLPPLLFDDHSTSTLIYDLSARRLQGFADGDHNLGIGGEIEHRAEQGDADFALRGHACIVTVRRGRVKRR